MFGPPGPLLGDDTGSSESEPDAEILGPAVPPGDEDSGGRTPTLQHQYDRIGNIWRVVSRVTVQAAPSSAKPQEPRAVCLAPLDSLLCSWAMPEALPRLPCKPAEVAPFSSSPFSMGSAIAQRSGLTGPSICLRGRGNG